MQRPQERLRVLGRKVGQGGSGGVISRSRVREAVSGRGPREVGGDPGVQEAGLRAFQEGAGRARGPRLERVECGGTARGRLRGNSGEAGGGQAWNGLGAEEAAPAGRAGGAGRGGSGGSPVRGEEAPGTMPPLEHKVTRRFCVGSWTEQLGSRGVNLETSWTASRGLETTLRRRKENPETCSFESPTTDPRIPLAHASTLAGCRVYQPAPLAATELPGILEGSRGSRT